MEEREKLLKYGWKEFLNSPFSLIFIFLFVAITYLIYVDKIQLQKDKDRYEDELHKCNSERLKDRAIYNSLIENLKINRELKNN